MRVKEKSIFIALLLITLTLTACLTRDKTIKVACIGDSITYGHGIADLNNDTYPAFLGKTLGENYEVKNFGVCGATCLKKGDLTYWDQPEYQNALKFKPDLIVVMLGSNDSKPQNWVYSAEYRDDYIELIEKFQSLKSNPKIWLCNPPPAFEPRWDINDSVITNEILPAVKEIAGLKHLSIIDFNAFFSDKDELFPDMIHPDKNGTKLIALEVAKALLKN